MTIDQYTALLKAIPSINANLRELGLDVGGAADGEAYAEDSEADIKLAKKVKARSNNKPEKSNIEATSDEEGD